jgi:hypothetical protein
MEGELGLAHRISTRLSPAEGRKFAFTVGLAFLALAGIAWWRANPTTATVLATLGGLLLLAGLLAPGKLGPVYRGWMGFALLLSKVTTPVFMGVVYFVVLTPFGVVRRLLGKNAIAHTPVGDSYWYEHAKRRSDLTHQF